MGNGMLRIQPRYLALAALLLCAEVLIARHAHGLLPNAVQHHALYRVLQIALGATFDPLDLLAYAAGFGLCLLRWPPAVPHRLTLRTFSWCCRSNTLGAGV